MNSFTKKNFENFISSNNYTNSKSQLKQDYFALFCNEKKHGKYFIEIGAYDGITGSNTYLLEKDFNWNGLLVEPSRKQFNNLKNVRNCSMSDSCIYEKSNKIISFTESDQLSCMTDQIESNNDWAKSIRKESKEKYDVNTISIHDLFLKYNVPKEIDYLSVDTEGYEYNILKMIDFKNYFIKCITIEHNWTSLRDKIYFKLTSNGFSRVLFEPNSFDDWYVNKSLIKYSDFKI